MKRYPSIKRLGHDSNAGILAGGNYFVVKEKLDGANFRFTLDENLDEQHQTDGRELVFGSRNVEYKNEKDIDDTFEHAIKYCRDEVDASVLRDCQDEYPLTVFCEAMHPHTLEYDWENTPNVIGFDVFAGEKRLAWPNAERIIRYIGLETAPVFFEGFTDHFKSSGLYNDDGTIDVPESQYRAGEPEGAVLVNVDTGQVAKYRTERFKEMHHGQNPNRDDGADPSDSVELARTFTTEARVLKMIHKYEDRGRRIEMGIMEDLWRDVFDDIIDEEYDTIFLDNHVINTKDFRSEVAAITANVLQRYLSRPDDSVLNEVDA